MCSAAKKDQHQVQVQKITHSTVYSNIFFNPTDLISIQWTLLFFVEKKSCLPSEFRCADGSKCIPYVFRCDGSSDCTDKSDELVSLCSSPIQCLAGLVMTATLWCVYLPQFSGAYMCQRLQVIDCVTVPVSVYQRAGCVMEHQTVQISMMKLTVLAVCN